MIRFLSFAAVALAAALVVAPSAAEAGGRSRQVSRQVFRGHAQAQAVCAPQVFAAPQVVYAQPQQLFAYPAPQQVFLPQVAPVYAAQIQQQAVCVPAQQQVFAQPQQLQQAGHFHQQTVISGNLQAGMIPY